MPTKYEYRFVRDRDPDVVLRRLREDSAERWEPVGFAMAPTGEEEYVVLVRREERTRTVVDERRFMTTE